MASTNHPRPVSGVLLSSVAPANVTGEGKDRELTNMDLAMKLHYIKGIYFFTSEAVQGLTIHDFKKPMFPWLVLYHTTSGRIRKLDSTGRPFIKCNDGGVRIVEANCDKTIEEWLSTNSDCDHGDFDGLVWNQVLGPDLGFSPLVFIQFTWFKCGGLSVGLSWSHVLGDAFSAISFINAWGQILGGHVLPKSLHVLKPETLPSTDRREPLPLKRVDPVGDYWVTTNSCKMGTKTFHFPTKELGRILSDVNGRIEKKVSNFEVVCAIIWKSLSNIRIDLGPKNVTICSSKCDNVAENEAPSNYNVGFRVVKVDYSVAKSDIEELAVLIAEEQELGPLEQEVGDLVSGELWDHIVYGANLTFVDMKNANVYDLEIKGHKPVFANYAIKGVGDEGAVLVLPGPSTSNTNSGSGRVVTAILPDNQLVDLKGELHKNWGIV